MNWQTLPVTDPDGASFNTLEHLRSLPVGAIGEWSVRTVAKPKLAIPAIPARLVAGHKTEQSAEAARRKLRKDCRRKGYTPSAIALEAIAYTFLITTVRAQELSAEQCLETYRFQWQIELAFKNLKSLIGLSHMVARSRELCIAFISAILITAILVDRMASGHVSFSPWGYATPRRLLAGPLSEVAI